ncbi:S-ribosylhomocysteine lyase, partial [Pantoea agglomerans]|nr:S-ribosylhomocysteine lyase [Pantoea agglomerans]
VLAHEIGVNRNEDLKLPAEKLKELHI